VTDEQAEIVNYRTWNFWIFFCIDVSRQTEI